MHKQAEASRLLMDFEAHCRHKGIQLTRARRLIARALCEATDHPDLQQLYARVVRDDVSISLATVYRTLKLFQEAGLLEKHDFKLGPPRYELSEQPHGHLVDVKTGQVTEFDDQELTQLQHRIAEKLGYTLVDYKIELYGVKQDPEKGA